MGRSSSSPPAFQGPQEPTAPRPEDASRVRGLFSRIAGVYDLLNTVLSFGLDAYWRKRLGAAVRPLPPGGSARILDLAAGTMKVSRELARRHPHRMVLAADFCLPMLQKGLGALGRLKKGRVHPFAGDGKRLPLPDACVDAVTIAFGLRNIRPRAQVYAEALRVLTPGGRFCVLEFGSARDRIWFGLYNLYLRYVLPVVGRLVSRDAQAYRYLADTVREYPAAAVLAEEMRAAGFSGLRYEAFTGGIVWLHTGVKPLQAPVGAETARPPGA
ncbi:ubiquinone/menaquinone biosynthesis methyltransferase [Desulfovibrio sp. OttesenSCG-928-A18]|nr:ubiquinone/menaquinone biosynthesis methyltransferase [Desulfovibrio sp. OttesenSCG-928-A18]